MSKRSFRSRKTGRIFVSTKPRLTLKKVNSKVNKIIRGIEHKRTLITIDGALTGTTGSVDWLSGVDLNTGSDDRIGEMITGKVLKIRYSLKFAAASTHDFELIRVMVVKQMQSNSTKPTAAQMLNDVTAQSFKNQATGKRFRFLYDRSHVLNRLAALSIDTKTNLFKRDIKLRNMKLKYNQTTVVVATGVGGEVNQLFLVLITDAGANPAIINFASDFQYTDI